MYESGKMLINWAKVDSVIQIEQMAVFSDAAKQGQQKDAQLQNVSNIKHNQSQRHNDQYRISFQRGDLING